MVVGDVMERLQAGANLIRPIPSWFLRGQAFLIPPLRSFPLIRIKRAGLSLPKSFAEFWFQQELVPCHSRELAKKAPRAFWLPAKAGIQKVWPAPLSSLAFKKPAFFTS